MKQLDLDQLIAFRRELHKHPELSNHEIQTHDRIHDFIRQFDPDSVIPHIGGYGLAAVYEGKAPGQTLAFRADIDALPIQEKNRFDHASVVKSVSHKCGHDGHTAMVAGLGMLLQKERPQRGRVVLIFQPAEETLNGAREFVNDPKFEQIRPDYLFGLHNFRSEKPNQINFKKGQMSPAVTTMLIDLEGASAHASRPEFGVCPYNCAVKIVDRAYELQNNLDIYNENFSMTTLVNFVVGKNPGYGTAPGDGHIAMTLRAYRDEVLKQLTDDIETYVAERSQKENLAWKVAYTDETIACTNCESCCRIIEKAAAVNKLEVKTMDVPMRGGEDVGYLINASREGGAFFQLGTGPDQPDLHEPDFDFPDTVIITGIKMYRAIIDQVLN